MKKTQLILAGFLLLATTCWGGVISIYPTADRLCRNDSKTTWMKIGDTMTPVDPSESFTTFELKYQAKLYAILQFEVPNFKAVKTMSFIFTKDDVANQATLMGVWNYSGYDMPQNNGTSATYTYQKATEVTGVEPGSTDETNLIEPLAQGDNKNGVWTFAIDANTIAPTVVYKEDGTTAVVQLLLTTYNPATRTNASKIFGYNADPTKMPHLDVEYVDYSKPVQEICYRTKSDNTGWNSGSYPMHAAATNFFEITHSSGLCAVYQYWLEDFDKSMNYTFTITKRDQETNVYAWEFPYALPQKNSDPAAEFAANVATVTGVALGTAKDAGTYNNSYLAISARKDGVATFTIKGSDLKNVVTDARGNKIVTLLLTSQLGGNYKYYNSLSDVEDAKKPSWNVSYINVYNETQELTYDDLNTACGAANAYDIIRVNNDLSTDARINVTKNPVTIYGRTPQTKIKFTKRGALMFLTKDYSGSDKTYIKNLTLVNDNNSPRDAHGVEVNKPTVLENVTFVSEAGYNAGYCDVYASQQNVTLVGNNVMPGGIRLADGHRIDDGIDGPSPRTTHTTPIAITMASITEGTMVVAHGWGARKDMYQLTNASYALYVTDSSGDLKAFEVQPITLSETEDNAAIIARYKGVETDITLARTIAGSASDYSTLCLPFETTQDELGAAEVLAYDHATIIDDEATLTFTSVTDLEAGKPYLVRFATQQQDIVFEDKTITAATPGKYGDSHYEFVGLYSQTKITETATHSMMYLGAANTLYWAGDNCTIKGSRGYLKAVSAPAMAARRVAIGDHRAPTPLIQTPDNKHYTQKALRNGQLVIIRGEKYYNAQGQIIK